MNVQSILLLGLIVLGVIAVLRRHRNQCCGDCASCGQCRSCDKDKKKPRPPCCND